MKWIFSALVFFCFFGLDLNAQDSRLAQKYYQTGEYEKAAAMYMQLYRKNPKQDVYFDRYINSLIALEDYDKAKKELQVEIKRRPNDVQLYVTSGNLYEQQFQKEKADKEYNKAIENLPANTSIVNKLGNAFIRLTKFDLALRTYEKGSSLLDNPGVFSYNLAELYRRKGDVPNMINAYLDAVKSRPNRVNSVKSSFQRNLADADIDLLKSTLYERINNEPEDSAYPELLEWVFIHSKDYKKAFRQARSMDRQFEEDGKRIYHIGNIAFNAEAYEAAEQAFAYIVERKGVTCPYYISARTNLLKSQLKTALQLAEIPASKLDTISSGYESFISEFGINSRTSKLLIDYAEFLAVHAKDLPAAISVLTGMVEKRSINKREVARAKIQLADYHLMNSNIWDASLLYSQVEKVFREDYVGELARFKNAKLFYYAGNFEWAQEQFNILKASTTKLISNDAIDLSVFITSSLGLDSTDAALILFSEADLYTVQKRYEEAFEKLDSILTEFPNHDLQDEVIYRKANIYREQKSYDQAIAFYDQLIEEFPESIKCDNSMYELAELYEFTVVDLDKAKALYEKIFLDYSNSTFAVESRKRYRKLRGDEL